MDSVPDHVIRTERLSAGETPVAVITLETESAMKPDFGEALNRSLTDALAQLETRPAALLLDVSRVKYMGANVLGVILTHYKQAVQNRIDFGICGASGPVLQLLTISRLDRVFTLRPSRQDALAAVAKATR